MFNWISRNYRQHLIEARERWYHIWVKSGYSDQVSYCNYETARVAVLDFTARNLGHC